MRKSAVPGHGAGAAGVLVLEDSRFYQMLIDKSIEEKLNLPVFNATTLAEAVRLLENLPHEPAAIVADLNLPDADGVETIHALIKRVHCPIIILTGDYSARTRELVRKQEIFDYILKRGQWVMDELIYSITRAVNNPLHTILIVDDSSSSRESMRSALERQFFRVTEADNGRDGLKKIRSNPDLSLVLLDYEMPQMNGFAFLEEMRQIYALDDLAVIGVSSHDEEEITIGFLKHGANDFIRKPFAEDEFIWRVNLNVKLVVQQRRLQDEAFHDYLTGLSNRRHFFRCIAEWAESQNPQESFLVVMADIDNFKAVNDHFGHLAGDRVIQNLALLLEEMAPDQAVTARVGGEEFAVIAPVSAVGGDGRALMEKLMNEVRKQIVDIKSTRLEYRISLAGGVFHYPVDFDAALQEVDRLLYRAKGEGRDRLIWRE